MDVEKGIEVANRLVLAKARRRLSSVEAAILSGSWQGQTYEDIASSSNYAASYLKRYAGPKLWQLLSEVLGEEVSKTNFRASLEYHCQRGSEGVQADGSREPEHQQARTQAAEKHEAAGKQVSEDRAESFIASPCTDWGEATDVSRFYGRTTELNTLQHWILQDRCRLISILGMGGMGKTSLSVKLAQEVVESGRVGEWGSKGVRRRDQPLPHHPINPSSLSIRHLAIAAECTTPDRSTRRPDPDPLPPARH